MFSVGLAFLAPGCVALGGPIAIIIELWASHDDLAPFAIVEYLFRGDHVVCVSIRWPLTKLPVGLVLFCLAQVRIPRKRAPDEADPAAISMDPP